MSLIAVADPALPAVPPTALPAVQRAHLRLRAASVRWSVESTAPPEPSRLFATDERRTSSPDPLFRA